MITHKVSMFLLLMTELHCLLGDNTAERRLDNTSSYISCTKHFPEQNFTIDLPASGNVEPFECKFYVKKYSSDVCRLKLNFRKFTLRTSQACQDQFLRIGVKTRLCGSIAGQRTVAFSESPFIFHYRGDGEHSLLVDVEQERCKIQATLNKNCDVTSSDLRTQISSPNFPNSFPTSIACIYNIQPNSQNICQMNIKFDHFELPNSDHCLKGRLLIEGIPYCGQKTGQSLVLNTTQGTKLELSAGSIQDSGSFHITITQEPCEKSVNATASQLELPGLFPALCCNRVFNSRNFILTSPGFLELNSPDLNCGYQIVRSSPNVCRLRMTFLHFWLGQEDIFYGCTDGFLEIDGRRICGCKDGLIIYSYFNGERKDFWLNMRGLHGKGFVIEVTQEDCNGLRGRSIPEETTDNPNTEVEVFATNSTVEKIKSRFFVPSDDSRCYQWGLPHWLDKVQTILRAKASHCPVPPGYPPQNTIIPPPGCLPQNPIIPPPQNPIAPPHFPQNPPLYPQNPIAPPQFPPKPPLYPQNPVAPPQFPPNPPLYPQNPIAPPQFPPNPPLYPQNPIAPPQYPPKPPHYPQNPVAPPQFPPNPPLYPQNPVAPPQFPQIPPPYPQNPITPPQFPQNPPQNPPPFPPYPPQPPSGNCQVLASINGGFQSPGYPWSYPPNLKCCYRFRQLPGYCSIQVSFLDFDLCWSFKCWHDFVLLDNRHRYCSQSLQSSAAFLPFRNGYASMDFITDKSQSGRGFRAVYRQIPCTPYRSRSDSDSPNEIENQTRPPIKTTTELELNVPAER